MPRPFPLPLRIGSDLASIHRFYNKLIRSDHKIRLAFIKKILTPEEWLAHEQKYIIPLDRWKDNVFGTDGWRPLRKYGIALDIMQSERKKARGQKDNISATIDFAKTARLLASRFAAKEAIMKAYPERKCTLWDIQVVSPPDVDGRSQAPKGIIKCDAGTWENGYEVPLSISHDGNYATATALGYMSPVVDSTARAPPPVATIPTPTSSRLTSPSNAWQSWPLDELETFCRIANRLAKYFSRYCEVDALRGARWVLIKTIREQTKKPENNLKLSSVSDMLSFGVVDNHSTRLVDLKPNVELEARCRTLYEEHMEPESNKRVTRSVELFVGKFSDFDLEISESPKDRAMKMQRGIWKGPTKWIPRSELSTEDNVVQEATNGDLHKRKQLDKKQEVPEDSVDGNEHDAEERKLRAALDQYISRRQGASLPASPDEELKISRVVQKKHRNLRRHLARLQFFKSGI